MMMMMMRLMVKYSQVAMGRRSQLSVYGSDWDTEDGTGECYVFVFLITWYLYLFFYLYLGH